MSLVFLAALTLVMWLGYAKGILLIQLAALCVMLFGVVWVIQNGNPLIVLLLVLTNIILFVMGVARR